MASLAEYEAAVAASSPTAWWKLDDASGPPVDSSGNGFDMSTENITEFQADGPFAGWEGKAIRCGASAGCSRANVGTATDNFTFECWVQPVAISDNFQFFMSNQAAGQGWGVFFGATWFFQAISQGVAFEAVSAVPLVQGDWYHLVVLRRSGTWRYYLNGNVINTNAGTDTPNGSPTAFSLLGAPNLETRMSQAAYYETALSDTEIADHYAAAAVAPPTTGTTWKAIALTVPGSTGSQSITGLASGNKAPLAALFFGVNWTSEDTIETGSGHGMFRGMACQKFDDAGTIVNGAACMVPPGDCHSITDDYCINLLDTSGVGTNYLARASVTSFDADGVTLDWDVVTAGGYQIVCLVLLGDDSVLAGAYSGIYAATPVLGFRPGSVFFHGAWGGPDITGDDRTQEFYGSCSYRGTSQGGWQAVGLSQLVFPTSAGAQYDMNLQANLPATIAADGGHFLGPFLVLSNILVYPTAAGLETLVIDGDGEDGGMVLAWNDEDSYRGFQATPDNTGDTELVSGLPFDPGLVVGYNMGIEPSGQGSGSSPGSVGFSVVTRDFQWSALAIRDIGAIQSFQRGFIDNVDATDYHAGTIELLGGGFLMTADEDGLDPTTWIYHAFGHPESASWLPHIYRRESG